jgi:hypothetical protein
MEAFHKPPQWLLSNHVHGLVKDCLTCSQYASAEADLNLKDLSDSVSLNQEGTQSF